MRLIPILCMLIFSAQTFAGGFNPSHGSSDSGGSVNNRYVQNNSYNKQSAHRHKNDVIFNSDLAGSDITDIFYEEDHSAASAYSYVTSLVDCPDTSGGAGYQTRSIGLSVTIARKDPDCAKLRLIQGLGNMYKESRRHQVMFDMIICTMKNWDEIETDTGFNCKQFLALSPDPATHKQ